MKSFLGMLSGLLAGVALLLFVFFPLLINREYLSKTDARYYYSISRSAGMFKVVEYTQAHYKYPFYDGSFDEEVCVKGFFGGNKFSLEATRTDEKDAKVHSITIHEGNSSVKLSREKSFEKYQELFLKADNLLKETRARFEKRLNEKLAKISRF